MEDNLKIKPPRRKISKTIFFRLNFFTKNSHFALSKFKSKIPDDKFRLRTFLDGGVRICFAVGGRGGGEAWGWKTWTIFSKYDSKIRVAEMQRAIRRRNNVKISASRSTIYQKLLRYFGPPSALSPSKNSPPFIFFSSLFDTVTIVNNFLSRPAFVRQRRRSDNIFRENYDDLWQEKGRANDVVWRRFCRAMAGKGWRVHSFFSKMVSGKLFFLRTQNSGLEKWRRN